MNSVERVKAICKERRIPISKLERDLGYANGYIGQLRKGVFPADRFSEIARYLSVSETFLMTGEEKPSAPEGERSFDYDIYRIERAKSRMPEDEWNKQMRVIEASFGDYFSDDYVDDDLDE